MFYYGYGFIGPLSELQAEYCDLASMYSDGHKDLHGSRWVPAYNDDMTLGENFDYLHASFDALCKNMREEEEEREQSALELLFKRAKHKRDSTKNAELRLKLSRAFSQAL